LPFQSGKKINASARAQVMSEESADIPGARRESTWKRIKAKRMERETNKKKLQLRAALRAARTTFLRISFECRLPCFAAL